MTTRIIVGDCMDVLPTLPEESVQTCITSPPYWGLRDYGIDDQLGLERLHDCLGWATGEPCGECYVCHTVAWAREVRRVLRDDGTLWVVIGDSYTGRGVCGGESEKQARNKGTHTTTLPSKCGTGLKPKDLIGIPWRVALALQADGWWLRSDVIWAKPNPMPESVRDRPTKAHEYIFLFAKSQRYYWDQESVKEPATSDHDSGNGYKRDERLSYRDDNGPRGSDEQWKAQPTRNIRTVWTVATKPFPEAHFATYPPALVETMIKASTKEGDTVLDPFTGAGTTGLVADRLGRKFRGIELNPEYAEMAERRIRADAPLLASVQIVESVTS